MEQLTDLKAILHSKRANIYYLEMCRVMQKDGRVLYLTEDKNQNNYWNIPIANTTVILLGTGTSITQAAVRMLAQAGVLIGFSGGGATPLLMATEIEWLTPQSEYRPTEYVQNWLSFWFDENKRLHIAKQFQLQRIKYLKQTWAKDKELTEAQLTKSLYKFAAHQTKQKEFVRNHEGQDNTNAFLNHGNYLAYGLAASTLWVLGIPHGFAVMHGKTRRGALVFDVADLIKDTLVLPWAFICAKERATEQEFRQQCLQKFTQHSALEFMFDTVKTLSVEGSQL
jgi:CRISPR-associated protein Cas1